MIIFNNQIYIYAKDRAGFDDSVTTQISGLVIEYVLNSKKITFIWHNGDQTVYKIAVPKIEEQNTLEFIRVYPLGVNDSFI